MKSLVPVNLMVSWFLLGPNCFLGAFIFFWLFPVIVPGSIYSWYIFANPEEYHGWF